MKGLVWCWLLAAGCVPVANGAAVPPARWVTIEAEASRISYPAGDGSVASRARVVVLVPAPGAAGKRRALPTLEVPARVEVGEVFRVVVRVPKADDDDRRILRLRSIRPGLRLLDSPRIVVAGRQSVAVRAVADSAGPASFDIEELTD